MIAWPAGFRTPDPRPLALGWLAVLLLAGALTAFFGEETGRAAAFGRVAWWAIALAPLVLGLVLAVTSPADREQYAARGLAAALMAPIGLAMWAGTADGPPAGFATWLLGLGALVAWLLAWFALLAWAARLTTRIDPALAAPGARGAPCAPGAPGAPAAPDAPAVDWRGLQQRLLALADGGAPFAVQVHDGRHLEVALGVDDSGDRAHHVHLIADDDGRGVRVIERLGAHDAAPLAHEASFHRPGDPLADPARPPVQRLSGRSRQTTILRAADVSAWPLRWSADGVAVEGRPPGWAGADADRRGRLLVGLLATVVVRSGWSWRPQLLGRAAGA